MVVARSGGSKSAAAAAAAAQRRAEEARRKAEEARRRAEEARRQAQAARQQAEAAKRAKAEAAKRLREGKNAFEGPGRRREDVARALGIEPRADRGRIAQGLAAERQYARLAAKPENHDALSRLGIRDGQTLQGFGQRIERVSKEGGPARADDLALGEIRNKAALANIIRGAGATLDGPGRALLQDERFASRVAQGEDAAAPSVAEARERREELAQQARAAEQTVSSLEAVGRGGGHGAIRAELDAARQEVSRLWREAGEAAAEELSAMARSGAPAVAVEAHASEVRATTDDPSFAAGIEATQQQAEAELRENRAQRAAEDVSQAFAEGGAPAAAAELNRLTTAASSPEDAAAILTAAQPTVDRMIAELSEAAGAADGDQFDPFSMNEVSVRFDRTVAELAAAASRAAGADGGQEVVERIAGGIATAIQERGIGRFDEALGNALLGGSPLDPASGPGAASSALAVEVMRQLSEAGATGEADDILQNVSASTEKLNGRIGELTETVQQHNQDLAQLLQDWGPLMSDEQRSAAVEAFRDSHPEYAQLDALAGPALQVLNGLHELPGSVASLDHAGELSERLDAFVKRAPDALSLTQSGQEQLGELLTQTEAGEGNLLDRIADVASEVDDRAGYLEKVGTLLLNNTVSSALAASAADDLGGVERALASLQRQAGVFGLGPGQMEDITRSLREAATAGTEEAAADALTRLDRSLQNLQDEAVFSPQGTFGAAFRAAGVLLGAIGTADSLQEAIRDPSFENVVSALGNAAGTGEAGIQLVGNMTRNLALLEGGTATALRSLGTVTGVLGAGLSTFQAAQAFADGDAARGGLLAAQAAGAVIALAGASGVGALVVGGAGLALMQLDRVRASNRFENEHTEAFLQAAGLSSDVTHHLRNADDHGRSVGPVLNALAERLDVEPQELLRAVGQLTPDQVLLLVEAAHGVDPNDEGEFRLSADSDAQVGQPRPGISEELAEQHPELQLRPESVEGLVRFLEVNGIELPGM